MVCNTVCPDKWIGCTPQGIYGITPLIRALMKDDNLDTFSQIPCLLKLEHVTNEEPY